METSIFKPRIFALAPDLAAADVAILLAALAVGDRAMNAYVYWRAQLDWQTIPVHWQKLLPQLHQNLVRMGVEDKFLDRIKRVRRFTWARNLKFIVLAKAIHGGLAQAGVPTLSLNGTALVASGFTDRSVRAMDDINILIPADHIAKAIGVLSRLGFEAASINSVDLLDRIHHEPDLRVRRFTNSSGDEVKLHWSDSDEPWSNSHIVSFEGASLRVPSSTDQLIHICSNDARTRDPGCFPWIADAVAVISQADDIDWLKIVAWSRAENHSDFMARALDLLKTLFDLPIGSPTIAQLYR
jgi:hypothetical protein